MKVTISGILTMILFCTTSGMTISDNVWYRDTTHTGKRPDCPFSKVGNQNYLWGTLDKCKNKCIKETTGKCNMLSRYGENAKTNTENYHCRFYACEDPFNFTWIDQTQWGNYANEANTYIIPVRHYTLESRYENKTIINYQNETVIVYQNKTINIDAAQPLVDLCINSIQPKNQLQKSNNRAFQIKSWNMGCEKREDTLLKCKSACNSPQGCCGITCQSNSCSGGGCCAASKAICKEACKFYFSPEAYNIITLYENKTRYINITNYLDITRYRDVIRNITRYNNVTRYSNITNEFINYITRYINKTRYYDKWINKTNTIEVVIPVYKNITKCDCTNNEKIYDKTTVAPEENHNKNIQISNNTIIDCSPPNKLMNFVFMVGFFITLTISIFATLICIWRCWLKDIMEDFMDDIFCCGYGDNIKTCCFWCCMCVDGAKEVSQTSTPDEETGSQPHVPSLATLAPVATAVNLATNVKLDSRMIEMNASTIVEEGVVTPRGTTIKRRRVQI